MAGWALLLVDAMLLLGLLPVGFTYTTVICARCMSQMAERALQLLAVSLVQGLLPMVITYTAVICACGE